MAGRKSKNKKSAKKARHKTMSGREILLDRVRRLPHMAGRTVVVNPEGAEKMSEVILDFAKPLWDYCNDAASERKAILLAVIAWNASFLPEKERNNTLQRFLLDLSPPPSPDDLDAFTSLMRMLVDRKDRLFSEVKRGIIDYQFSGFGAFRRLNVVSVWTGDRQPPVPAPSGPQEARDEPEIW